MRFNDSPNALTAKGLNGNHALDMKSINGNGSHSGVTEDGLEASPFTLRTSSQRSSYYGHDREQVSRILMQALSDMGYHRTASMLESESEYSLESPEVASFRSAILRGEWRKAEKLLFKIKLTDPLDVNMLLFYLRQQKFLELLEVGSRARALEVMRSELVPLDQPLELTRPLASLMLCSSVEELKRKADWDGSKGHSRSVLLSELSKYIAPSSLVPKHRLATMLHQLKDWELSRCVFHNSKEPLSLYTDHAIESDDFPSYNSETLYGHDGEVWCVAFSHDGERLASVGADGKVLIWNTETFQCEMRLEGHEREIFYASWSPDDTMLLTSGRDDTIKIWDMTEPHGTCILTDTNARGAKGLCWVPDGQRFVTGSVSTKIITVRGIDGSEKHKWHCGKRILHLDVTPDGRYLVALSTGTNENFIFVYNFETYELEYQLNMEDFCMCSLQVTQDSKYALVNMFKGVLQQAKLLNIETGDFVRTFEGGPLEKFEVRACLGGASEQFIASGSLNSLVYIWHREHAGNPIAQLRGHNGIVNGVSWNPAEPRMFATAGDDKTVRIWTNICPEGERNSAHSVEVDERIPR